MKQMTLNDSDLFKLEIREMNQEIAISKDSRDDPILTESFEQELIEESENEEAVIEVKKKKAKKVIINVEYNSGRYAQGVTDYETGRHQSNELHHSVGFMASTYGMGNPCDSEEEILSAIEHAKQWIIKEGDKPVINYINKPEIVINEEVNNEVSFR